jgi:hypothetical protein
VNAEEALEFLAPRVPSAFPEADTILLSGSTATGRSTPNSDLDLVVFYKNLPEGAWRRTEVWDGQIVEAFVHDLGTLRYFLEDLDSRLGVPTLAHLVLEGLPVAGLPNTLVAPAKAMAQRYIANGPPPLSRDEIDRRRYTISNLVDDITPDLPQHLRLAIGANLYTALADFALRASGEFSGQGKGLARALETSRPDIAAEFAQAFAEFYAGAKSDRVGRLVDTVLAPHGGPLIDDYLSKAPADWRRN